MSRFFKPILALSVAALGVTPYAHADTFLGIYADAGVWSHDGELTFTQDDGQTDTFKFDKSDKAMVDLALEHGVPLIPNIKLKHTDIEGQGNEDVSIFNFGGVEFTSDTQVHFDVTNTDIIAYYEVLDNIITADVGVGAKIIDGDVMVSNILNQDKEDISQTIPVLYAAAGGNLPLTGLSAKADITGLRYEDDQVLDASAKIQYDFINSMALDLGIFAGYRVIDIDVSDVKDTDISGEFEGVIGGISAHF